MINRNNKWRLKHLKKKSALYVKKLMKSIKLTNSMIKCFKKYNKYRI